MLIDDNELYQKGLIITDNFSKKPILDFEAYRDAIVKIIKKSYPNFTIGIFGEWGTGKTSLMNSIKQELDEDKNDIKTIWFDAWKYENEKEFALIPLLKTIAFSLKEDKKCDNLKDTLREAAIFTLGVSEDIISSMVTTYAGKEIGGLIKKSIGNATTKLIPQLKDLKKLSEIDENSIFYNGIDNIQNEIDKLRDKNKGGNSKLRFVIFVDDLDRCSPEKVLEILESIKIFLSLNGIIYVLGVSHDTIVNLINEKYKIDGEKYLRKFIQIPITLTEWNESDIDLLINYLLENDIIHKDYKPIIKEHKEIIASAIEENPRETKRFLNNLIISYEVFVKIQNLEEDECKRKFFKQLLLIQILNSTWKDIYRNIMDSKGEFLKIIEQYIPLIDNDNKIDNIKINNLLNFYQNSEGKTKLARQLVDKYQSNDKLWKLLTKDNFQDLREISDFNLFRRATKISIETEDINEKAIELLQNEEISSFNLKRGKLLKKLDLVMIDLTDRNLVNVNLANTNLSWAILANANLSGADLKGCNLSGADLKGCNLSGADLKGCNLSGADLQNSIIINAKNWNILELGRYTNFSSAIIDNSQFVDYIMQFTEYYPEKIDNIKQLREKLIERGILYKDIQELLSLSKLPQ